VRTYGKKTPKPQARTFRQQTLTQIDFVSSFENDDSVELTDSEAEDFAKQTDSDGGDVDKENKDPELDHESDAEDQPPVSSGRKRRAASTKQQKAKDAQQSKRRRTLGDETEKQSEKTNKKPRRKTLGDPPSSNYHTQTLTQLLREEDLIRASDDEEDGGFADWLGDPTSPSPRHRPSRSILKQVDVSPVRPKNTTTTAEQHSPATSVIPQTPAKRLRFEIPSSSQQETPTSSMMNRYGPPDKQTSPLKQRSSRNDIIPAEFTGRPNPRRRGTPRPTAQKLVVEDTFATDSWSSPSTTPTKATPSSSRLVESSSSMPSSLNSPTKPSKRGGSTELGNREQEQSETKSSSPKKQARTSGRFSHIHEIPDSDEEDDEPFVDDAEKSDDEFDAGPETQFAVNAFVALEHSRSTSAESKTPQPQEAEQHGSIDTTSDETADSTPKGPSKQQLPPQPKPKRLRMPLHHPISNQTLTQPLESQRVALHILQDFPPATVRTDILLSVEPSILDRILEGYQTHVLLPFKAPVQAVRFWLYDGTLLRYMACPEAGERADGVWRYHLRQIYELNNPVDKEDMREDGWIDEEIGRYVYLPPAVVGQLLWNLRHAIFDDNVETAAQNEEATSPQQPKGKARALRGTKSAPSGKTPDPSLSVSQQIEEQIQSDIAHSTQFQTSDDSRIPSTPDEEDVVPESPSAMPPPLRPTDDAAPALVDNQTAVRPSQATTVSQASTYEMSSPSKLPPHMRHDSSSNLSYQDYGESVVAQLPSGVALPGSSQILLSKSQMLSDSLLQDDRLPPEIWDSDSDADERL
jgi:hypothetical protein